VVFGFLLALSALASYVQFMPRRLRIESEDAIYHVMTRGNARQDIVHDDDDRRRLLADLAAWLCRRHSEAPLRKLAQKFGLSRADSVPNLTRRIEEKLSKSPGLSEEVRQILELLGKGSMERAPSGGLPETTSS
jgi:hypothetical protein